MKMRQILIALTIGSAFSNAAAADYLPPDPERDLAYKIILVHEIKERAKRCGFEDVNISVEGWRSLVTDFTNTFWFETDADKLTEALDLAQMRADRHLDSHTCDDRGLSSHAVNIRRMLDLLDLMDLSYRANHDEKLPGQP